MYERRVPRRYCRRPACHQADVSGIFTAALARPHACRQPSPPPQERTVNKQDMIEAVAKQLDLTKVRAGEIIELFFGTDGLIASELKKGGKVQITGFGNFETRKRVARQGRNPRTGKTISIKASNVPAFRAGKGLKELVNKKR
jgi:DNA-binding protein HU-beta